jgi:hypothetical protein
VQAGIVGVPAVVVQVVRRRESILNIS